MARLMAESAMLEILPACNGPEHFSRSIKSAIQAHGRIVLQNRGLSIDPVSASQDRISRQHCSAGAGRKAAGVRTLEHAPRSLSEAKQGLHAKPCDRALPPPVPLLV